MATQGTLRFKVLMLGDGTVGKTTFKNRFLTGKFTSGYTATMGADFATHNMTFNDRNVIISIWDLAGQPNQSIIRKMFYKGSNGALLLYDVTKEISFLNIEKNWLKEIFQSLGKSIPLLLIANKVDLDDKRLIQYEKGLELLNKIKNDNWMVEYLETSALMGTNVNEAFTRLIQSMIDYYDQTPI